MEEDIKLGSPFDNTYQKGQLLGTGSSGQVFRARHETTGIEYAIKVSPTPIRHEFDIGSLLDHPSLVKPFELWFDGIDYYIVMGLVSQVSMLDLPGVTISEKIILLSGLAKGLRHMHKCGFLHCDIKPTNFGFDVSPHSQTRISKLFDFGLAKPISSDEGTVPNNLGTVPYLSPEALKQNCSTTESDAWAFTMCLMEIMMGLRTPFVFSLFSQQHNMAALVLKIGSLKESLIPASFRQDQTPFGRCLLEILETGLAIEPKARDLEKIIRLLEQLVDLSAES